MPAMHRRLGNIWLAPVIGMLLAVFAALPLHAVPAKVPALTGRVNDYASMISPQARAVIEAKLQALEQTESTQIAILTVPSLGGEPIEDYSIRVAEAWKLGDKARDNGILLIVSKEDRKVRIEVGYGLEGRLTDLQSGRIISDIIRPAFAKGDFDSGFIEAVDALVASVKGEFKAPAPGKKGEQNGGRPSIPLVFIILFVLFIYLRITSGRRHGGPFIFGGPGSGGFYTGGGFGSSGGGGGFSGGGGGFGGGGASGDW